MVTLRPELTATASDCELVSDESVGVSVAVISAPPEVAGRQLQVAVMGPEPVVGTDTQPGMRLPDWKNRTFPGLETVAVIVEIAPFFGAFDMARELKLVAVLIRHCSA